MIIFMGVAGAGKSVQGNLLADLFGYEWVSTGEYLRANITGQRKAEMLAGKLLDDQEIIETLNKFFDRITDQNTTILDGFPRTLVQAKWLFEKHKQGKITLNQVVYLNAPIDVVKKRLLGRGRQDDTEEALKKRFEEYEQLTLPIIDWFQKQGISVYEIDASGSVEEVHKAIVEKLRG